MQDWGWEARESGNLLGLFLQLEADFSQGSEHHRWFTSLKLKHYQHYPGPFTHIAPAFTDCVGALLENRFYKELRDAHQHGTRISYGSFYHEILLMPSLLVMQRAWGYGGTEASDKALIQALLARGIEIGEWFIQDLDFGNEWVRNRGTASFRTYLGLPAETQAHRLSELFAIPPRWQLRGDPVLWQKMAQASESLPWPSSPEQLTASFSQSFKALTGTSLAHNGIVYLPAFDQGGLSGGQVSPADWRETVLPWLQARYQALLSQP